MDSQGQVLFALFLLVGVAYFVGWLHGLRDRRDLREKWLRDLRVAQRKTVR